MAKPRALLTGQSGFTGRYVAAELEIAGYEVFGLTNHKVGTGERAGYYVQADLLDREAVRQVVGEVRPNVVLHLAGIASVSHGDIDEMYRVNISGTWNLLDAVAAGAEVPDIVVLASSANVYGNAKVEPICEGTPTDPANDYAVSKVAMEYMAKLWMDRLPIVITRPFNYTGIGQSEEFLIPKIVGHFRRRESVINLGNTDVVRDFGDVRDVAKCYVQLLQARPVGRTLNICTGVGHSLDEVLSEMATIAGYRIAVEKSGHLARKNEVRRLVGSNLLIRDLTGWWPSRGISETLRWMYFE